MLVSLVNLPNRDVTGRVAPCHLQLQNPLTHGTVHGPGVLQNTLSPLGLSFSNCASWSLVGLRDNLQGFCKEDVVDDGQVEQSSSTSTGKSSHPTS